MLAVSPAGRPPAHHQSPHLGANTGPHRCKKLESSGQADAPGDCDKSASSTHVCSCSPQTSSTADDPNLTIVPEPLPIPDGWELEEQLRHIERVLKAGSLSGKPPVSPEEGRWMRLDAAHRVAPDWHQPTAKEEQKKAPKRKAPKARQRGSWTAALSWVMLSLGSMALAFGGVLLGWSMTAGRDDLWAIGMPVAVVGQLVLLAGFILQLDRLWRNSREASTKLDDVDQRLDELKTTTSLLGTTHSSAAASFYSHMAGGAHPQLLLVDLKNQLDLLSVRLSQIDR